MRVFSKSTLRDFYEKHNDCKQPLLTWYKVTTKANWRNFSDVKQYFNSTDCIRNSLLVFNIKGNKYRLVVDFNFRLCWAFIIFIGPHGEYEEIIF